MKKIIRNHDGMALVTLILFMLIFGALGLSLAYMTASKSISSVAGVSSEKAKAIAEGGLQWGIQNVLQGMKAVQPGETFADLKAPVGSRPFDGGSFQITYLNQGPKGLVVRSTATVDGVSAAVEQTVGFPDNPLPFSLTANEIHLSDVSQGTIAGDIAYRTTYANDGTVTMKGLFLKSANFQAPLVDYATYTDLAKDNEWNGDLEADKNLVGNYYVKGNLTLKSGVSITGVVVVDGSVTLESPVTVIGTLVSQGNINGMGCTACSFDANNSDPTKAMPVLVSTNGNIDLSGSQQLSITGTILSVQGSVSLANGINTDYKGAIIANQNILMTDMNNLQFEYQSTQLVGIPGLNYTGTDLLSSLSLSHWKSNY